VFGLPDPGAEHILLDGEFHKTRYIPSVRELVRRNLRFFLLFSAAALLLRLIFLLRFPGVVTDSFIYGDIAKNWLQHGIYGLSGPDEISPTYIRLPGYPAFLAFIFAIFGVDHYRAVLFVQMLVDLGTCFLCAAVARRLFGLTQAKVAFILAALCPFLADYSAAALTETLEVFFTALTLHLALRAFERARLRDWAACGAACGSAILLRPDGVLLLVALEAYLLARAALQGRSPSPMTTARNFLAAGLLVAVIALLPLAPWAVRNWHVFHRFQPLAPRYANEEDEFVPMGFNRWVKTWIADYTSVEEIYWAVPGSELDAGKLPLRAFDTPKQQEETVQVVRDYNPVLHITPELDARFEAIAEDRIHAHPARYYLWLPAVRIADMWMRPRTEMLPSDSRWWEFDDEPRWLVTAIVLGAINLLYVLAAIAGWLRSRQAELLGLLVLFLVLRSAFLGTLENPEPRYTLEMYPIVIVLAAAALVATKVSTKGRVGHAEPGAHVL
jgi:4-amino-4-deoxy-L-arabinose transferase-like glycosyltransferase